MTPISDESLPTDVTAALVRGEKIEAIKLLRERSGIGLKEAKDAVEAWADRQAATGVAGRIHVTDGSGTVRVLQFLVFGLLLAAAAYFALPLLR